MRTITIALLVAGFLATLGFMIYAGEPERLSWWPLVAPFAGWVGVPYAVLYLASRRSPSTSGSRAVLLLGAAAVSGFGILMLYEAFIAHPDAQSGIVLIFIPLYQLAGLIPLLLVARLLARRS
ncbi:MAG: hypothetical protein JSW21_09905 [Gammaproteobacteria bacterium]|nr:MAG: hypothetical protein JSW21_09905 [Gammaproteobacteria bacterium]